MPGPRRTPATENTASAPPAEPAGPSPTAVPDEQVGHPPAPRTGSAPPEEPTSRFAPVIPTDPAAHAGSVSLHTTAHTGSTAQEDQGSHQDPPTNEHRPEDEEEEDTTVQLELADTAELVRPLPVAGGNDPVLLDPDAPTVSFLRPGPRPDDRTGYFPRADPAGSPSPHPRTPAGPRTRSLLPGLELQPMVHVDDMPAAVAFYEKLGGEVNHGDRAGEWVLMQVGTAQIGLVTRPPNASRGESTVELNFTATMPLDQLEQLLRERGVTVTGIADDRDLGVQLHIETPEGMPVKIHQVEPVLLV